MRSRRAWLVAVAFFALTCSHPESNPGARPSSGSETPQAGGVLRISLPSDPASMNPLLGQRAPFDLWRCFYPSLIVCESNGAGPPSIRGDLARRWAWSEEDHALTLVLRRDRSWQDSVRVRSADVVQTFNAYRALGRLPAKGVADSLDTGLTALEALDDSTVRARFRPDFPWWKIWPVLSWPVLPAHKLLDLRPDFLRASPLAREPLSAGPFRLLDWRRGLNLWLGPNPLAPHPPWCRRVAFEPCPGVDARVMRLALGGTDVVLDAPLYRLASWLDRTSPVQLHRAGVASVEMLFWNLRQPQASEALREAIDCGINRDRLADAFLSWQGNRYGGPAGGLLEPAGPPADAIGRTLRPNAAVRSPRPDTTARRPHPDTTDRRLHPDTTDRRPPSDTTNRRPPSDTTNRRPRPDTTGRGLLPDTTDRRPRPDTSAVAPAESLATLSPLPGYDPEHANHLLDEAGWEERGPDGMRLRDGLPLRIEILYDRSNGLRERIVTLLEEDLSRLGVTLVPVPLDGPTVWRRFQDGIFTTALLGFRPPLVPDLADLWASDGGWNGGGYFSARTDSLIRAERAATSAKEVERLCRLLESQIRRDRPALFLVYREEVDLLSARVRDFRGTVDQPFGSLEETWLADTTSAADSASATARPKRR